MVLIISVSAVCFITGGFFSGTGFVKAFSASDASVGLMLGSFFALVVTVVFYAFRKVLKFRESMECVPEGFKAMVPAILILTFAWTLKAMTDSLGAAEYVANVMQSAAGGIIKLPACNYLPRRMLPCICNWNIMGNIRNPDPDRSSGIPGNERDYDDHLYLSLYGGSCMWRSLFAYFGYNDHGIRGSAV